MSVTNGTLTVSLAEGATISAGANSTATLTLSGTQTEINAALGTVIYQGNLNFNGSDTLTMLSSDSTGTPLTDSDTVAITVNAVADAPVNTVSGAQTVEEDTALTIGGLSVNDVDGNLATSQLSVTNGALTVSLAEGATISAGANSTAALTLSGTQTEINEALGTVIYQGNLNFNGSDTLTMLSSDSTGTPLTDSDTVAITVNAVADAPVNTVSGAQTVEEDTALTIGGLSVNDVDGNLATSQLSVTNGTLTVSLAEGATISAGANSTAALTLSGTQTEINAALGTVIYQGNLNFNGSDTLTMLSSDSTGTPLTDSDTVAITVNAVADAPVNTVSGAQTVEEDTALTIGGLSVNDVDGNLATSQLSVTNGTLTVSLAEGATISAGANSTAALTLSGTQTEINAALGTVIYQGNLNFNGSDTLTMLSSDSTGTPLTDSDTVAITVNAVADAPVNTVSGAQTVEEDTALTIGGLSVNDVDGNLATSQLSVTNGTLTVSLAEGATISAGANSTAALTLSGTQTEINAALGTVIYQGNLNFNGSDTLTMLSSDSTGTPLTDSDTVAITVNAVADAPVNTVSGAQTVEEDTALTIGGLSVNDVDGNLATSQLSVTNGTLTVSLAEGATISAGANSTAALTLSGTQTEINAALGTVIYQGNLNFNGSDTLTMLSSDSTGTPLTDSDTVAITVNAVADAPVNTVSGAQTVDEDTALTIGGLSVNDVDGNLATSQLSVTNGTLTVSLAEGATISAGANSTAALTLSGTQTEINAALGTVIYQGNLNFNGSDTLTMLSSDSTGTPLTDSDTVAITVNAVADAPINTVSGAQTVDEDTALTISEFQANSYTTGSQYNPSVASLSDGGFVVTWESYGQDGSMGGVFGQKYTANGVAVGDEFQINTETVQSQSSPSVAGTSDGGFVVTWGSWGQDESQSGIFGQRYDAAGIAVGDEFQVNSTGAGSQTYASVAADTAASSLSDGGFVVTWTSRQSGDNDIYGQKFDAEGTAVGEEFRANTYTQEQQGTYQEKQVASLGDGGFVVVWNSYNQNGNATRDLFGQRYDADGTAVGDELQVNTTSSAYQAMGKEHPSVAGTSDGGFVVTWTSDEDDIYGQRYDTDGTAADDEFLVNTITDQGQRESSVTGLSDGGFVVTWTGPDANGVHEGDGQQFLDRGIFAQRYGADGTTVGGEFQIDPPAGGQQTSPSVTALDNGGFVAVWRSGPTEDWNTFEQFTNPQDGDGSGIFGQIFDADTGLSVNDVDGNLATSQLSVTNGTLTVSLAEGATISAGANSTATLTLSGTQTEINAALGTVIYQGNLNFNGSDTLTMLSSDSTGTPLTDSDTVAITVNAVADAPVNTVSGAQTVEEDTALTIGGLSVNDVDGNLATSQLSVTNGALTVSLAEGATISAGANSTAALTLSGTQTEINEALGTVIYQGNLNFNGSDTLTMLSSDSTGTPLTDSDTVAITVNAVADAPVNTVSGAQTVEEDTALTIGGLSVNDVDGNLATSQLSVTNGTLTVSLAEGATISAGANSTAALTLSGTQTEINAALGTVIYQGNLNFNGSDTLTMLSSDSTGTPLTDSDTVAITVNAVADAPVNTVSGAQTVEEDTALTIGGLSVNDVDGNLATSQLSVTNGTLTVSLAEGATISAGANSTAALTLSGTQTEINAALGTVIYQGNLNFNGSDTLTMLSSDSTGTPLTDSDTVAITVNAVADAPVNTVSGAQTVEEDTALTIGGLSVNDVDGNLATSQLSVTNGTLTVSLAEGATISAGANSTAALTLSGTQTEINAALGTVIYQGNLNFNGSDTLTMLSSDSTGTPLTDSDTVAITVNAVADAPVNTVSGAQTVEEDTALTIGGLSVNDVDGNLATSQLSVTNGTLTVSLAEGATISAGANSTAALTLSGTQTEIDAALGTVIYQGNLNFNGSDTLTMLSSDSTGTPLTDSDTVAITVNAVADAPVNTVSGAQTVDEDTALTIGGLSVNDVDGNLATSQLSVTNGTLTVSLAEGATISAGANSTAALTLSGTQTEINAALGTVIYQGNLNFNGSDTLTMLSSDSTGTPLTDSDTVAITVNAVADAPINTVSGAQTVDEDTALTISEFQANSYTTGSQYNPSVASLSDGGFVVTWESYGQDGSMGGVFGQKYTANGVAVGDEFQINTETVQSQSSPSVAGTSDGGFVVTWGSWGQDESQSGIFGQRYDAAGIAVGDEFQVNSTGAGSQTYASVAADTAASSLSDGGFVVTWTSRQSGDNDIYGQKFDAEGTAVGEEFRANTYTQEQQGTYQEKQVASLGDGGFVVVWNSYNQNGNATRDLFGQRYDADGTAVGDELQVNTTSSAYQAMGKEHPSVAGTSDGGFVVTWTSDEDDIYGQRYDTDGTAADDEFLVNTITDQGQRESSVTGLSDGGFVVTWTGPDANGVHEGDGQQFLDRGIFAQRYGADGTTVGGEFQIDPPAGGQQTSPSVTALDNGGFVAVWRSGPTEDWNTFEQFTNPPGR